nr:glycosyltransferase [Lachnospiraceae bacterium]
IHNSCSTIQIPADNEGCGMHSEKTPYIIAITSTLPHKNAAGIIRAYEKYYETAAKPLDIIVIGIEDTGDVKISDKALSHVKCIKYLEDNADLYRLISGAKLMLFLSLIEGFGFPPLEAMQMGTPVICSNTSSLPEVVGDAALLVDPEDADFAANAIRELIEDENLQETLVQKGYENIKRFSSETRAELYWKAVTFTVN